MRVDLLTPDGVRLRSTPLGPVYLDAVQQTWRCFLSDSKFAILLDSLRSAFTRLDGSWQAPYLIGSQEIVRRAVFETLANYDSVYLWGIHGGVWTTQWDLKVGGLALDP
jgi:hypothetical protein